MSQNPHPHDPYAAPEGDGTSAQQPLTPPQGAPHSDPNLYPHDPFAGGARPTGDPLDIDPAPRPEPQQASAPQPSPAAQDPYAAPASAPFAGQAPHGQQGHAQQQPYAQGPGQGLSTAPVDIKGVFDGPLTGQAVSDSDSRMWSLFAHLSAVVGYVVGVGFLGWLGPLIIFVLYKDRDRFVRFNAAEALNAAIAALIATIALWIVIGVIGVLTLGFGFILSPIAYAPALVHVIFAIIGAVKSNQGTWWNYPVNLRLVK